jgi:hypothetical protein
MRDRRQHSLDGLRRMVGDAQAEEAEHHEQEDEQQHEDHEWHAPAELPEYRHLRQDSLLPCDSGV